MRRGRGKKRSKRFELHERRKGIGSLVASILEEKKRKNNGSLLSEKKGGKEEKNLFGGKKGKKKKEERLQQKRKKKMDPREKRKGVISCLRTALRGKGRGKSGRGAFCFLANREKKGRRKGKKRKTSGGGEEVVSPYSIFP